MTDDRSQESGVRRLTTHDSRLTTCYLSLVTLLVTCHLSLVTVSAYAQDDLVKFIEKKRVELTEKEDALEKEDERLKALRRDVDERIDKYTKLLSQIEETLKKIEAAKNERMEHLVKTYEAMPTEEAAARLSALDEPTAVKIIFRMKSKKAGAVMAAMEPKKVAAITESMTKVVKKFPIK